MIRSRGNRLIKDIRRLRRCKGDLAVLEGPHLIAEALAAALPLRQVLATPDFLASPAGRELAERLPRPPLATERKLLDGLCDADSPRGVLATAELPRGGVDTLPRVEGGIYLFLDGLQDPGNLGAVARSAEAAGACALALSRGTVHPNHPRALRASAGSLLRIPLAVGADAEAVDRHLAPLAPEWLALVPRGGVEPATLRGRGTLVLALGAEGPGLDPRLAGRAWRRITVPLEGRVESLNAAVAAAVVLFELRAARRRR